jgi:hypothetical protein
VLKMLVVCAAHAPVPPTPFPRPALVSQNFVAACAPLKPRPRKAAAAKVWRDFRSRRERRRRTVNWGVWAVGVIVGLVPLGSCSHAGAVTRAASAGGSFRIVITPNGMREADCLRRTWQNEDDRVAFSEQFEDSRGSADSINSNADNPGGSGKAADQPDPPHRTGTHPGGRIGGDLVAEKR